MTQYGVQQRVYETFRTWFNQQIHGHYGRVFDFPANGLQTSHASYTLNRCASCKLT